MLYYFKIAAMIFPAMLLAFFSPIFVFVIESALFTLKIQFFIILYLFYHLI